MKEPSDHLYPVSVFVDALATVYGRFILFHVAATVGTVAGAMLFGETRHWEILVPWYAWLLMVGNWVAMVFSPIWFAVAFVMLLFMWLFTTRQWRFRALWWPFGLFMIHATVVLRSLNVT